MHCNICSDVAAKRQLTHIDTNRKGKKGNLVQTKSLATFYQNEKESRLGCDWEAIGVRERDEIENR